MYRDTFLMIALAALFVAAFGAVEAMSAEQPRAGNLSPAIALAVIPFNFWIGDSQLPVGEYCMYSTLGLSSVVLLRNTENGAQEQGFLLPIDGAVPPGDYELIVVTRHGEHYLREIWKPDGRSILTAEFASGDVRGDTRSEVPLRVQGTPSSVAVSK
jgi:hypothetical protein